MTNPNFLHESNEYDDNAFPFGMYTVTATQCIPPGRGYLDLHWHEELQFTLVTKGTITIQINGIDYNLEQGEAIFINCGFLHVTTAINDDGEYVSFNFPDKMLSFFAGSRMEQDFVIPYTSNYTFPVTIFKPIVSWQNTILNHLWELRNLAHKKDSFGHEYLISMKITKMWFNLVKNVSNTISKPSKNFIKKQERMQLLIAYIHENYGNDISLSDIANAANISTGECCRCFKNMFHTTPYEYLLSYRLNRSIELLNTSNYSITEIAGMVGFNYSSHFIQIFKKKMHKTPNEYRKKTTN